MTYDRCGTWRLFDCQPILIAPPKNGQPPILIPALTFGEFSALMRAAYGSR